MSRSWTASLFVVLLGCGSTCAHPNAVTYSTDPLPAGTPGCSGTPLTYANRATAPDPNATFAAGTIISFPFCNGFYPNATASCECGGPAAGADGGSATTFVWGCGL